MTRAPSRFAAWQEANQIRRESTIDEYLAFLTKTRVKVRNPTDLADLVARHISQVEGKPCNKATLLRNVRYKARLLSFQAKSLGSGAKSLDPRTVKDPTAKALITGSQLESGNLKRELERLKVYVDSLEVQVDQLKGQRCQIPIPDGGMSPASQISDLELRFIYTCKAMMLLVSHFKLVVKLDARDQRILDMSKRRDNIIVDKEVAGPFFEWLASLSGVK